MYTKASNGFLERQRIVKSRVPEYANPLLRGLAGQSSSLSMTSEKDAGAMNNVGTFYVFLKTQQGR